MAEQQPGQVEQSSVRAPIFTFRDQVKDFARPNLFQVEIYAPPILQDGVSPAVGGVSGSQADANETASGGSNLDASAAKLSVRSWLKQQTSPHLLWVLLTFLIVDVC